MPPTRASGVDETLGHIRATIEAMAKRDEEDRNESRERGKKMDSLLERMTTLDAQMRERLAHVEEKAREQSRDTLDRLNHFKHETANSAQVLRGAFDVMRLQFEKVEKLQSELQREMATVKDDVGSVKDDVAAVKVDVASVKGDTQKLRGPVDQFVAVRNRVIAISAAVVSVMTLLFVVFRKAWDEYLSHLISSWFQ